MIRVGTGNFTLSRSQIRTWYSRIIQLVKSMESYRIPLGAGFFPLPVARPNADGLHPFAPAPLRGLRRHHEDSPSLSGASELAAHRLEAACAFSLGIAGKVLTELGWVAQ